MEEFKQRYPHLYVDLSIGDFNVDFNQHRYDIAIRSVTSAPQGCQYVKLMDEDLCLVCSPQLATTLHSLNDINSLTLLKHTTRPELWPLWSKQVGLRLIMIRSLVWSIFICLARRQSAVWASLWSALFIEQQLSDGSLVIPFDNHFTSPYSYYVLSPQAQRLPAKAQAFIDWLLEIFAPYRH